MKDIKKLVEESRSLTELSKKLGYKYLNGKTQNFIENMMHENNVDYSHFKKGGNPLKYKRIQKKCPICSKTFQTLENYPRGEKVTCSYSCSNTYFRSGEKNPNWSDSAYRTTCFLYHNKKCIICDEMKIVSVHHFDENEENNAPENLMPLCPTHHQYWHSKYKSEIYNLIVKYRDDFIKSLKKERQGEP